MAPATPGTVLCLAATVCLALASFSTPLIKQLYFLRANISTTGFTGKIDLGTLGEPELAFIREVARHGQGLTSSNLPIAGYCTNVGGTQTCSSPSVGYDLGPFLHGLQLSESASLNTGSGDRFSDLDALLNIPIVNLPQVVGKWLTYVLVLHIVGESHASVADVLQTTGR